MLHRATCLDDLRIPPNIRLEALKRDRKGQHSIRINGIVRERRAVTVDTALRMAKYFGTSAEFWMGLQTDFDMATARPAMADALARIVSRELAHG